MAVGKVFDSSITADSVTISFGEGIVYDRGTINDDVIEKTLKDPDFIIHLANELKKERKEKVKKKGNCSEPSRFSCKSVNHACMNEHFYMEIYLADTPHRRNAQHFGGWL